VARKGIPKIVELRPEDRVILRRIADYMDASEADVMRWALRWYALRGPWTDDVEERQIACEGCGPLCVGPRREEVK